MITVLDVETNIFGKGNPFSQCGKLISIGLQTKKDTYLYEAEQEETKNSVQKIINNSKLLIGFNIKFDLHWIKRYGINFDHCQVWDCQLAHFLLTGQECVLPSLNKVCEWYELEQKLDIVKTEYWEKGIDTENIPIEILNPYLEMDLCLTNQVYHKQLNDFKKDPQLFKLFKLQCLDLLVLQEMEFNGLNFNTKKATELKENCLKRISEIEKELRVGYENIPINFQSHDHVSCYLYGGDIISQTSMPVGHYKTGPKAGMVKTKKMEFKNALPRLIDPPRGSELVKEGFYATSEPILRGMEQSKKVGSKVKLLLERAKLSKLVGTYYEGIPELITKMDWRDSIIHGSFNQCIAATGRLSSSKPNLQNFAGEVDKLIESSYNEST